MSILKDTGATTLTKTWYQDGTATDVGTVTIGIDDADGTEVVATGTATTNAGSGVYTYSLAVQDEVKILTITWTADDESQTDVLEVVGGWLFTETEIRAFQKSDLSSSSLFTDAAIAEVRDAIAVEFETICGVSFVSKYGRQVLAGSGGRSLDVAATKLQSVLACTISGTSVDASDFAVDELAPLVFRTNGAFTGPTTTLPRNVTISYRHGWAVVPPDIKQAALVLARIRLISNEEGTGIPAHASSWTDASGSYQAFAANAKTKRWYGMPTVDIPLARHQLLPAAF